MQESPADRPQTHAEGETAAHLASRKRPAPPATDDSLDASERDVSALAMVGLLVIIASIGLIAWGLTTPGVFGSSSRSMECGVMAAPGDPSGRQAWCVGVVHGQRFRGTAEEVTRRMAAVESRANPGQQRFWFGLAGLAVGVTLTAWGAVRARRAALA